MRQSHSIHRDVIIALVVQLLATLWGAITLDMGQTSAAIGRISIGYWIGVAIVLLRRRDAMTRGDQAFIRYGLVPLQIVGLPLAMSWWAYRGAI